MEQFINDFTNINALLVYALILIQFILTMFTKLQMSYLLIIASLFFVFPFLLYFISGIALPILMISLLLFITPILRLLIQNDETT